MKSNKQLINDKINSDIDVFLEKQDLKNPEYQISALGQLYYNVLNKMSNLGYKNTHWVETKKINDIKLLKKYRFELPGKIQKVRYQLPGFEVGSDKETGFGAMKSTSQLLGLKHLDGVSSTYTANHESINKKLGDVDKVKEMIEALNTVLDNNLTGELGSTIEQKIQNQLKNNLNNDGQYTMPNGEKIIDFDYITDAKNKETKNHLTKIKDADNTKEEVKSKAKEEEDKRIAEAKRKEEEAKRKAEEEEEDDENENEELAEEEEEEDDEEEDDKEEDDENENEEKKKSLDKKNIKSIKKQSKSQPQSKSQSKVKSKSESKISSNINNQYKKGDFILVEYNDKYNIHEINNIENGNIYSTKTKNKSIDEKNIISIDDKINYKGKNNKIFSGLYKGVTENNNKTKRTTIDILSNSKIYNVSPNNIVSQLVQQPVQQQQQQQGKQPVQTKVLWGNATENTPAKNILPILRKTSKTP